MYRENALKKRLAAGRRCLGAWLFTDSGFAAEIMGHAGYDFILIDHEHGYGAPADAVRQLQALQAFAPTVLMRVAWNDPVLVKRALDTGIEGIMLPMIDTADQARAAVAACRYPPDGIRGCANVVVRAADWGLRAAEYLATANDNVFVMVQIESPQAVDNIPEIAAVDGVDALFIGPSDLAARAGHPGDYQHPEVAALLERAEAAVRAAGKPLAAVPHSGLDWQGMFERGYNIVAAGSDVSLLREAARNQMAAHRAENG